MNTILGLILFFSPVQQDTIKTKQLEELVIVAVRGSETVPISEKTIGNSLIERNYVGQEGPVLFSTTPSVTFYSDGGGNYGYSYYRLRGIDQTRINTTLNGVPLNEPEDQGAYFTNYPDFLNSVNSVQIQRGVGLSVNGVASFAGAINFEGPSLSDSTYAEVQFNTGSYQSIRFSYEQNIKFSDRFKFYGRLSELSSDGFRRHSGTEGGSAFLSLGYFGDDYVIKFTGFAGHSVNDMAYLAASKADLKKDYRINYLTEEERDKFSQSLMMLQFSKAINSQNFLTATGYFNRLKGNYDILFSPDILNFALTSNWFGGFVNYHYESDQLNLVAGVHLNDYKRNHFMRIRPDLNTNIYFNTGHKNEFSGFIRTTLTENKTNVYTDIQIRTAEFKYVPDQNYDLTERSIRWSFINPKFGVSHQLDKKKILYGSIGLMNREPTRNDMFAGYDDMDGTNVSEIGDLKKVKPERVLDFETGFKFMSNNLNLDFNWYFMKFKDEIAAIGELSYIGLPLRKNVESSSRYGIEFSLEILSLKDFKFRTNGNLNRSKIDSYTTDYNEISYKNVTPLLSPTLILNQTILYSHKNFEYGLDGRYVSSSYLDNTQNDSFVVPKSFIINGSVNYVVAPSWRVGFIAYNLLNQKYYSSGYIVDNEPHYFAMATRNYTITLNAKF